jgi:hypothetical protein
LSSTPILCLADRASILPFLLERIKNNTQIDANIPANYYELISQCLEVLPSKRPSCTELQERIFKITDHNPNETLKTNGPLVSDFTLAERFYLWNLCGTDVCTILVNRNVIKLRPPILSLPFLVIDEFYFVGNENARQFDVNLTVHVLPHSNLDNVNFLRS